MLKRAAMLVAALSPLLHPVCAQIIPVKTAPMAEGDRLAFLPSANLGMGGVSIAVADSLLDPFTNPAKAARLTHGYFFGSPSTFSLSRHFGGAGTLPIGAVVPIGSSSFGGVAVAFQQISPASREVVANTPGIRAGIVATSFASPRSIPASSSDANTNRYLLGMVGRHFAHSKLSIASSVLWSTLGSVDGAELLYPGSSALNQTGDAVDLRAGLLKEWDGDRSLDVVLVHRRYAMSHEIGFRESIWDPGSRLFTLRDRTVSNNDRTHLTGVQITYVRPLGDSGWRAGVTATGNHTTQPTAPQGMMNIRGDPGRSTAFDVGVGISRSSEPYTFGVDAIVEPIWTRAHGVADDRYRFLNAVLRVGASAMVPLGRDGPSMRVQGGVQVRDIHYQRDLVDVGQLVTIADTWTEWTHSAGASYRAGDVEFRYLWRMTSGVSRPGFAPPVFVATAAPTTSTSVFPGILPIQTVLMPVRVVTHQLTITVPIL